jgi:hypothetical protein
LINSKGWIQQRSAVIALSISMRTPGAEAVRVRDHRHSAQLAEHRLL